MPFPRGAIPSPRHELLAATPFKPTLSSPPQFARVPKRLSMWGNNQYGDCVSAEEAFAKIADTPNVFIEDQDVINWARRHGVLNGATLTDVLNWMRTDGMPSQGVVYTDGEKHGVDWTNQQLLCDAIATGTVKIAIAADGIEGSGAGNLSGWYVVNGGRHRNIDHCVSLTGYGPADYLYGQLGLQRPTAVPAGLFGYLLFTWSTIGFVDHPSMVGFTDEAWVRIPTTTGYTPTPPPIPPVPPVPQPAMWPVIADTISTGIRAGKTWAQITTDVETAVRQWAKG